MTALLSIFLLIIPCVITGLLLLGFALILLKFIVYAPFILAERLIIAPLRYLVQRER